MGDSPMLTPPILITIVSIKLLHVYLATLCLNGTPPCVDFMDVTMGDILSVLWSAVLWSTP